MRYIKLYFFCIISVFTLSAFDSPLLELEATLAGLQNRSTQITTIPLDVAHPLSYEALKQEIEISLQNQNTNNLDVLNPTQTIKTAKFLLTTFFSHAIKESEERKHTAHYILLIARITEFLKAKFTVNNSITILAIKGMRDPMEYAYLIFALDNAGLKELNLLILGEIEEMAQINRLKAYISQEKINKRLTIKTSIEYYRTVPELLTKDHRVNLYLYKFRPSKSLMGNAINNAMICTLQPSQDIASIYFLEKEATYIPAKKTSSEFLITQNVKSISAVNKFIDDMSFYTVPTKIIRKEYKCLPIEEELIHISTLIHKTKTKSLVPFFFYTDFAINFLELPTKHIIDTMVPLIRSRINFVTNQVPQMTIYNWDNQMMKYVKYKDR